MSDILDYISTNPKYQLTESQEKELVDTMSTLYLDLKRFCKVMFPKTFRLKFTPKHYEMCEALDEISNPNSNVNKLVISAFRGCGKTSLVRAKMARDILFRNKRFVSYVAKTATYAESQTENLKRSLTTSSIVKKCFGSLMTKKKSGMDESWSKKTWIAQLPDIDYMTCVLPRGAGQQVRGLNFDDYRPDLFQVDDLEDDEFIDNELYRDKIKRWFRGPLSEAVQQAEEEGVKPEIVYTDTVKHPDSLIIKLIDSPYWEDLIVPVCDSNYKTYVPSFMSQEILTAKVEEYRGAGELDIFAREFMCEAISKEMALFKQELFQTYLEGSSEFVNRKEYLRNVVLVDPARTSNQKSAETGFVVWGIDVETNRMYIRYAAGLKVPPDEIYRHSFNLCERYNALILGVETHGGGDFILQPFMNEMVRRGRHYEFVELKPGSLRLKDIRSADESNKAARVRSLVPFYNQGLIYHNKVGTLPYEHQLIQFPRPTKWDMIDAASYIVQIMEEFSFYFLPQGEGADIYEYPDEFKNISPTRDEEVYNEADEYLI